MLIQESSFFLAESLTVFMFGRLSDIYGRRPVLLLAPLGLCIAMLGFGLSTTFWTLFAFRCAQGAFNGNIGAFVVLFSPRVSVFYFKLQECQRQ